MVPISKRKTVTNWKFVEKGRGNAGDGVQSKSERRGRIVSERK